MAMSKYTKRPMSFTQYTMMRGTVDYSNAKQFNFYESGYSFLVVLSRPKFIEVLANSGTKSLDTGDFVYYDASEVESLLNLFCFILENEFRGVSGLEDITAENLEFTDGISTIATLGKTIQQSNAEISMQFTERSGAALTSFVEFYLKGCKASRTQARTYHGLIAAGILEGGFEHEVFNFMYIVTDNTLLGLEKAYLFVNAWPNKAPTSIYESEKGTIEMKQIDLTFVCFVMDGEEVNRRAVEMLAYINEPNAVHNYYSRLKTVENAHEDAVNITSQFNTTTTNAKNVAHPDSDKYNYAVYDGLDVTDKTDRYGMTKIETGQQVGWEAGATQAAIYGGYSANEGRDDIAEAFK